MIQNKDENDKEHNGSKCLSLRKIFQIILPKRMLENDKESKRHEERAKYENEIERTNKTFIEEIKSKSENKSEIESKNYEQYYQIPKEDMSKIDKKLIKAEKLLNETRLQKQNHIEEKKQKQAIQAVAQEVIFKNLIKELNYDKSKAKMDKDISQIEEDYWKRFEKRYYPTMEEIRYLKTTKRNKI